MNIGIYVSFQIMVFWGSYLYFLLIRYYLKGHLWVGLLYWTGQAQNISSLSLYSPHAWLIVFQPPCEAQCAGSTVTTSHPSPTLELGFPCGSSGQESACNAGDPGSIPGWGRSPEEGNGNPTHSSILAWKIPWTEEHGSLQSMGLQRVRHNWVTITFTLQTDKNGYNLLMAFLWDISVSCSIFSI